jgi:hypothetical protein
MNRLGIPLHGKIVVLDAQVFQSSYRALPYRVWRVTGGYGASPVTQGNTVYCQSLLTGETTQFSGMAIERIATERDLAAVEQYRTSS